MCCSFHSHLIQWQNIVLSMSLVVLRVFSTTVSTINSWYSTTWYLYNRLQNVIFLFSKKLLHLGWSNWRPLVWKRRLERLHIDPWSNRLLFPNIRLDISIFFNINRKQLCTCPENFKKGVSGKLFKRTDSLPIGQEQWDDEWVTWVTWEQIESEMGETEGNKTHKGTCVD